MFTYKTRDYTNGHAYKLAKIVLKKEAKSQLTIKEQEFIIAYLNNYRPDLKSDGWLDNITKITRELFKNGLNLVAQYSDALGVAILEIDNFMLTPEEKFKEACKEAISEKLRAFKSKAFTGRDSLVCPKTGQSINYENSEVEVYDCSLDEVIKKYKELNNIKELSGLTRCLPHTGYEFKDNGTAESFLKVYLVHTKRRIVSL